MIRVLCVPLLVVAVSCKPHGVANKNCCPPDKYEGFMGMVGGYSTSGTEGTIKGYGPIAVDRSGMKVAFTMNEAVGPTTISIKVVQDFKAKVQYVADLKNKTCTKSPLVQPFYGGCVPDTVKPIGNIYYGIGTDTLNTVSYMGKVDIAGGIFDVSLVVTEKDCAPVGETVLGKVNNVGFTVAVGFVNITEGIKDMSVFDLPPYCQQAMELEHLSYTVFKL